MNERLRFCRYTAHQQFNIHQDGVHHRALVLRSMLTFMIYLTDGEAFSGGDTEFFADGPKNLERSLGGRQGSVPSPEPRDSMRPPGEISANRLSERR